MRDTLKLAVVVLLLFGGVIVCARYFQLEQRVFGYSVTDYSYELVRQNAAKIHKMLDMMLESIQGGKKKSP